jgi:hypothetical protein
MSYPPYAISIHAADEVGTCRSKLRANIDDFLRRMCRGYSMPFWVGPITRRVLLSYYVLFRCLPSMPLDLMRYLAIFIDWSEMTPPRVEMCLSVPDEPSIHIMVPVLLVEHTPASPQLNGVWMNQSGFTFATTLWGSGKDISRFTLYLDVQSFLAGFSHFHDGLTCDAKSPCGLVTHCHSLVLQGMKTHDGWNMALVGLKYSDRRPAWSGFHFSLASLHSGGSDSFVGCRNENRLKVFAVPHVYPLDLLLNKLLSFKSVQEVGRELGLVPP